MTIDHLSLDHATLATATETSAVALPPSSELAEIDAHLETLAQEVAHLRLSLLTESAAHQSTVKPLRRRLDILTVSMMLMALGLVVAGTWFFSSPQGVARLRQPMSTTRVDPQLKGLEKQIADLQGGANPTLVSQIKALEAQVKALDQQKTSVQTLEAKITELSSKADTRQQTITTLAKALQEVIDVETNTVPSSDSAANPAPANPPASTAGEAPSQPSPKTSLPN